MSDLVQRMKSGLRRVGDWLNGRDVEVAKERPSAELLQSRATLRPAVDIYENRNELLLVADVPGAVPESTQVHSSDGQLSIWARTSGQQAGESADWYASFTVPQGLDLDRTEASVRDGVLRVRLPKEPRPAPRRIAIKTGA